MTKIERICQQCGKEFTIKKYRIKQGGGKYCSLKCVGTSTKKGHQQTKKARRYFRERQATISLTGHLATLYLKERIKYALNWKKACDIDVPPELVELKRAQLNLYREARKCLENSRRLTGK